MTIEEFYEKIGGDYNNIVGRLCNDAIISKFVLKFTNEKSYDELMVAVEENDIQMAIAAAHKMKGVVANLSFNKMFVILNDILAWLREENQKTINMDMIEKLTAAYNETIQCINELQ